MGHANAFERCNLWLLYSALARGVDRVRFICLWDGGGGDGPGGTAHLYREVKRRTEGLSLFYTDLDRRHVDVREIPKMGRSAVDSNELFIDQLPVPTV